MLRPLGGRVSEWVDDFCEVLLVISAGFRYSWWVVMGPFPVFSNFYNWFPRVSICVGISICVGCPHSRHTVLTFLKKFSVVQIFRGSRRENCLAATETLHRNTSPSQIQWDLVHFARVPRQQPLTEFDLLWQSCSFDIEDRLRRVIVANYGGIPLKCWPADSMGTIC